MDLLINLYVKFLILNCSNDTMSVKYLDYTWLMPLIGPRPPYYINPKYDLSYPII